eukprot:3730673-Rhodomonas_salina.1
MGHTQLSPSQIRLCPTRHGRAVGSVARAENDSTNAQLFTHHANVGREERAERANTRKREKVDGVGDIGLIGKRRWRLSRGCEWCLRLAAFGSFRRTAFFTCVGAEREPDERGAGRSPGGNLLDEAVVGREAGVEADGPDSGGEIDGAQAGEAVGEGAIALVGEEGSAALPRLLEVERGDGGEERPRGEGARAAPPCPRGDDRRRERVQLQRGEDQE